MFRILIAVAGFLAFGLGAGEWQTDFATIPATLKPEGQTASFQLRDGGCFYDTTAGDPAKHRSSRLASAAPVGGDFRLEFGYEIKRIDHWNGFQLEIASKEFNVRLGRIQREAQKHFISAAVTVNGKKEEKQIAYGAFKGALVIERRGGELILCAVDSRNTETEVMKLSDFPQGDCVPMIKFDSPPKTYAVIQLRNYSQKWSCDIAEAFQPVYLPVQKLADAKLLAKRNAAEEAGGLAIAPGGKALFAVQGVWNMRGSRLEFDSSGPLKLRVTQPGFDDTIELGDTLIYDDPAADAPQRRRQAALGGWIAHYPEARRWELPHVSSDNIFFITVSPSGDVPVTISNLSLHASVLRPAQPLAGVETAAEAADAGAGFLTLQWASQTKCFAFQPGERLETGGTLFRLSPTMLSPELPALTIPVNRKCGAFYVLQTTGNIPAGSSPLIAACQVVYEDDSTETLFFVHRWNTGVFRSDFQARGSADHSWWGPVGFSRARIHYLPRPPYFETWDAVYRTSCINPSPGKTVRNLTFYRFPGDTRDFALLGVTLRTPEHTRIGLIEPERAVFEPGMLEAACMEYSALPADKAVLPVFLAKQDKSVKTGVVELGAQDRFRAGFATLEIPANELSPGPVTLAAGDMRSSRLGLMGTSGRPFQYVMISGGTEPRSDYERIYRLGYDAAKIHLPWVEKEEGKVEFPGWEQNFKRIANEGLKIEIRNHVRAHAGPPYMLEKAEYVSSYRSDKAPERAKRIDPADPYAVSRFVNLYRETAKLAARHPVVSINANYGLRTETGIKRLDIGKFTLKQFQDELAKEFTLKELAEQSGDPPGNFDDITPERILADPNNFYLPRLVRLHMRNLGAMQRKVCEAIREGGFTGHLTFNTSFHTTEQRLLGVNTGEYLRLGRDFPPGSLYHETSDRYSLSFTKWLLAKRTLGLPYGDEGNQPPPTYEHCILAYHWMAMMQCFDAVYCQWFGGKPAVQNLAWIKPFHRLLYDAEYLPDPVALSLSLESGTAEAPEIRRRNLHETTTAHTGLANLLRELNINADRYMVDEFPELDEKITARLMIDDISRSIPPEFGDRIEKFIRAGGVFLVTPETDRLNGCAFLKRFGLDGKEKKLVEKTAGRGKIIFRPQSWADGRWDTGTRPERREEVLKLLTRLGGFTPLVRCDTVNVFVTPYRAPGGDLLLHVINITGAPQKVRVSYQKHLAGTQVLDHGTEHIATASTDGIYHSVEINLEPLAATVLRAAE